MALPAAVPWPSFNEATAFTPRKLQGRRRMVDMLSGFNEATAFTPRKCHRRRPIQDGQTRFNEATAFTPRKYFQVTLTANRTLGLQ